MEKRFLRDLGNYSELSNTLFMSTKMTVKPRRTITKRAMGRSLFVFYMNFISRRAGVTVNHYFTGFFNCANFAEYLLP